MIKKPYFLIGITTLTIIIFSVSVYVITPRGKPIAFSSKELGILFEIVRDGDIICRLGNRSWSQHLRNVSITDRRFSHMGIIRVNDGLITVIHAEGDIGRVNDFVREEPLEDFIKYARAIGIYRINDIDAGQISNLAIEYLGMPFDWSFDMQDNTSLYCTELLYVILRRIAPELELKTIYVRILGRYVIPLEAISNSIIFSEIFYINSSQ
ncbi:MAG: hypothetical protein FWC36_04150 [Spirochaetes bacterium]|nr:hypothetical protein [Spirochaetota bacterium]